MAGCAAALGLPAQSADARPTFNIPAQSLGDALLAFGRQAGVSVGITGIERCAQTSRPVVGRYTPRTALTRMLRGSRCEFTVVDGRAFSVGPAAARAQTSAPSAPPAPEPPPEPAVVVLDLVVTTTRRPVEIGRTPASISVSPQRTLAVGQIDSLQELAPEFAGVTMTNLGPGRNKVFVRGMSDGAFTGRTQSTVGLFLDDVPITFNAPDPDLRLIDVERVELMRGPQGSLYGVGSMGGIVRIVTRTPDLSRFDAGVAIGAATTQSGAPSYSADVMVNAPIIQGRLGLRGVAYSSTAGGYVDDGGLALKDANQTRHTGGRLTATLLVAPEWEATLGMIHQTLRADDSQYTEGGLGSLRREIRVREPHHNVFSHARLSIDGMTPIGKLKLSGAYVDHAFETLYDASSGLIVFDPDSTVRTFEQRDAVRLGVFEAVLASYPGARLQWLAGVFGSRTSEDLHLRLTALDGSNPGPLYIENREDRLAELAAFGELTYAITPRLGVTVGARAFRAWQDTRSRRSQGILSRGFSGSNRDDGIAPKAVLSWQAGQNRLLFLQAAQGYRSGGFNTTGRVTQQFNAGATGNQPNRRYRPDTLWSYEAGAKGTFWDDRLEVRAAAFYSDWRDVQSDQFLPSGLPYTANVGRAVNTGFEGEAALRVTNALSLRASFLANSPKLRQRDPTYPARPNASLPAVPRNSATLVVDWRRTLRPGLDLTLYGRVAYIGTSVLTFQEQADSQMGNYVSGRLAASLEANRWRLTAFVDNPSNAKGDTFAFGDPFTQGRVGQSTPLRPRTFGLSLARGL